MYLLFTINLTHMKKELLKGFIATLMIVAGSVNASAQEWNFSNASGSFGAVATYAETTSVAGLTIYAASTAVVSIDGSNKTFEDYTFTHRLKLGGTGAFDEAGTTPVSRVLAFPVSGNTSIKVIATHSSSSGDNRFLYFTAGNKANKLDSLEVTPGSLSSKIVEYTGGATTIYLFSKSSGINLYLIKATATGVTGIEEVQKETISTEYYNVTGIKTNKNAKGLILERNTYSDGSVCTIKRLNNKN